MIDFKNSDCSIHIEKVLYHKSDRIPYLNKVQSQDSLDQQPFYYLNWNMGL